MAFLREVPLLAGLPDELLADLGAQSRPVHLAAGGRLFSQGDAGDAMYLDFKKAVQSEIPGQAVHVPMRMGQQFTYVNGKIVD